MVERGRCHRLSWLPLVAGLACAKHPGAITPDGYENKTHGYRVPYADRIAGSFLGPDWVLDNFYKKNGRWTRKEGPDYIAIREFDENDDGELSATERNKEPIYDLRFQNSRNNGILWLKIHPLHPSSAELAMDVIVRNYADSLQGAGLYAQGSLFSLKAPAQRQFVTFLTGLGPSSLGGHPAAVATVEMGEWAKVDKDPNHRDAKVRILFAKFERLVPLKGARPEPPWPRVVVQDRQYAKKTLIAAVGYYNTVDHFDEHLAAFDALRQRFVGDASLTSPPTSVLRVPAAPPPATIAPPAPVEAPPTEAGSPVAPGVAPAAAAPPVAAPAPATTAPSATAPLSAPPASRTPAAEPAPAPPPPSTK